MKLTNEDLIELSKFAIKAKKHIGLVKVTEMFTNHEYACNILTKATLSGDQELADLKRKIGDELNVNVNVITAIEAYINILKAKDVSHDSVQQNKYFLIKLAQIL